MRTTDFVRLLLTEMLAVLVVHQAWSSEVGLDKACVEKNGTVCNRRPPNECNLDKLQPSPARQRLSINPETLFHVSVFVNYSTPTHLRLEWMQDDNLSHPITVRITPLLQGRILEHRAICMSSLGPDNETLPQIHWPDSARNGSRHITMVPISDNMTTAIVEINTNSGISQYMVQTPRFSRHSWILPGISITAHNNKGYLSITPRDMPWRAWGDTPRVTYTVTLVCHLYNNTGQNQTADTLPMTIISMSPVTNCSSTKREIYMRYLRQSRTPIVFEMAARLAYSVVIDAQMVTGSSNQVIAETGVTTPIFAYVGTTSEMDSLVVQEPEPEVSTAQADNVYKLSAPKSSATRSVMAAVAGDDVQPQPSVSGLITFPAKNGETLTKESITIIIVGGVVSGSAFLAVVIFLFITWRARKNRTSTQQEEGTSDKLKVYEDSKIIKRQPPCVTEGDGPGAGNSRMPRFRSQCCTNRVSDVPSSGDSLDPLISHFTAPEASPNLIYNLKDLHLTSHDILDSKNSFRYDDLSRHLARRNYLQSKEDAYQGRHLPHGPTSRELEPLELDEALIDGDGSANTKLQCIAYPPLKLKQVLSLNLPHVADFKIGSNLTLTSGEDRIYEGAYSEDNFGLGFHVVTPSLLSDNIDPMIMRAECLKINQEYETFNAIVTDSHNYPSSESSFEDECFSLSESIAW